MVAGTPPLPPVGMGRDRSATGETILDPVVADRASDVPAPAQGVRGGPRGPEAVGKLRSVLVAIPENDGSGCVTFVRKSRVPPIRSI